MGGSGQRLGLAMGSHEGVFFIVSKIQLHSYHSTDSQPAKGQSFDRGLTHLHTAQNSMFQNHILRDCSGVFEGWGGGD